jgi:hypothetical protein
VKKIVVIMMVLVMFLTFGNFVQADEKAPNDGFENFYKSLKKAVNSNNRQAISGLMAEQFQWAEDGIVSKEKALESMNSMKIWGTFKKALNSKPYAFVDSSCQSGDCCAVWIKNPLMGFIFKKIDGQWKWSELRAD